MQRGFPREYGELEHVHELMAKRVAKLRIAAAEWQRDPALEKLSDAKNALGRDEREDVRLLEVDVGCVHDEGNALTHFVAETASKRVVALLGVHQGRAGDALFFGIEEHVHVLSREHVPIEATILDLVLAEAADLGVHGRSAEQRRDQRDGERDGATPATRPRAEASSEIPPESRQRGSARRGRRASCAR